MLTGLTPSSSPPTHISRRFNSHPPSTHDSSLPRTYGAGNASRSSRSNSSSSSTPIGPAFWSAGMGALRANSEALARAGLGLHCLLDAPGRWYFTTSGVRRHDGYRRSESAAADAAARTVPAPTTHRVGV